MVDWQGWRRLRRLRVTQIRVETLARLGVFALAVTLCASWAGAALADGGDGGVDPPTAGGTGGTGFTGDVGGNGGSSGAGGGGGGGGGAGGGDGGDGGGTSGVVHGTGGPGGTASDPDGNGGTAGSGGGGGGGGGWNGNGTGTPSINNTGMLTGGNGGNGGNGGTAGSSGGGGGGGAGGYGAIVKGSGASSNSGTIAGGAGGAGGSADSGAASTFGGNGGDGGVGVQFTPTANGAAFTNSGTVSGGNGGAAGGATRNATPGNPGAGGAGIVGAGLTVINGGTIMGGMSGDGTTRANAITFTGGSNTLELRRGFAFVGNVVGTGADTLRLGGTANSKFNVSTIGAAAQFQGFGAFQKTGSSTWTLQGTNAGALPWTVSGGTLVVNGNLANSPFTVNGGTLGGTGPIGAVTVNNGGVYAPGNSIGTQTVNGNFRLRSGAVYEVEVNAAGKSDKVIVKGTVNLTGSTLRVLAAKGNYKPKTNYRIITNDGTDAVKGKFAKTTINRAFLTPSVNYQGGTGNDVVLTLTRPSPSGPISFCDVAKTRNQCNVAMALDRFPTDNPLFLAVLNQTASGARQAFDALSGEIHATLSGVLADDSRYVREAMLGRMMQATYTSGGNTQLASLGAAGPQVASLNASSIDAEAMALGFANRSGKAAPAYGPGIAFWTRGFGAWGDFDGNRNAATANRDLGGFVSGMDAQVSGSWRAGLATGASFSNIDVNARSSAADVDSYYLGGYTGGMAGPLALRGGGTWAWQDIDTSRAVIFPGFYERQKASYDADTGQIFGEVAYPTEMGGIALEPFGGIAYVSIDTDRFREHGGKLASLRGSADQDVGYSTVGLRAASTMQWGAMQVVPHVSGAWQHAFDDVTPGAALAFASTGIGFAITGVPLAEDSALIDAGLDFALGPNTTAGVSYSGQFGDGVTDNAVKGRLTWLF
jgi:outer membrane autotransporter protein